MQYCRQFLAIALMLLIGPTSLAFAENQPQVEQILALFDRGEAMSRDTVQQNIALLEKLISNDDVQLVEKLNQLKCWNQTSDTEAEIAKALNYAKQALSTIPPTASTHYKTDISLCYAWYLQRNGDVNGALEGFTKGLKSAYQLEDIKLIADARSLRGALYSYMGDFSAALDDLVTAQGLYESLNLTGWANLNLGDIATSFRRYGDPESAIKYYEKLKQLYLTNANMEQVAAVMS